MESAEAASIFCQETANASPVETEVSFITTIDSTTGEELYFVQPWDGNSKGESHFVTEKWQGKKGRYWHGNKIIRQDHWATKKASGYTTGGEYGYDWKFACKINGPVWHHDGGGLRSTEYTPLNGVGNHFSLLTR